MNAKLSLDFYNEVKELANKYSADPKHRRKVSAYDPNDLRKEDFVDKIIDVCSPLERLNNLLKIKDMLSDHLKNKQFTDEASEHYLSILSGIIKDYSILATFEKNANTYEILATRTFIS
jgi:hypothetical protein